jgi:uncharacterized protein (TIGR02466 family)
MSEQISGLGQQSVIRETEALFPTIVQISRLPNAKELNSSLKEAVKKLRKLTPNGRPDSWMSTVYTTLNTADQLHLMPEFAELTVAIMAEAHNFAANLSLDQQSFPLVIKDCWANVYGPKDGQEMHLHSNSIISGSYYLQIPEGASGIVLHSPMLDQMFEPPLQEITPANSGGAEIAAEEGMLLLFRSYVKHSVRPSAVKRDRISISFNLSM